MEQSANILQFGSFELDLANRELRSGGEAVPLGSRYLDALALLVTHPGELVTKGQFMDQVWGGIPVTDEALTQCIRTLRRALGDKAGNPGFIETVPKHGYRFLAQVHYVPRDNTAVAGPASGAFPGKIAGAATIAGCAAGALGGLFYGIAGTDGSTASIMVLIALTSALGLLAGAGVGTGMGAAIALCGAKVLSFAVGGAAGGLLVGAVGQILARDSIAALTGIDLSGTTGILEGTIIGLAVGLATGLSRTRSTGYALVAGAICGMAAGAAIAFAGGRMLGLSLFLLEDRFPASRLDIGAVGSIFGERGFYMFTILGTTLVECAVFASCISIAINRMHRPS